MSDGEAGAEQVRERLRHIDLEIVRLVSQRTDLLKQLQKAGSEPLKVWEHQDQTQALMSEAMRRDARSVSDALGMLFRSIASATLDSTTRGPRASYLGPQYSYSHGAALQYFGEAAQLLGLPTIRSVFESVAKREADYGMVPIENSTDGGISDTLSMFTQTQLRICGEVPVAIHHCLLSRSRREQIREIYSKPQAISQCRDWLARNLPSVRCQPVESTAVAAELAASEPNAAAIASSQAAAHYGLEIVERNIEDVAGNTTRFVVLGHEVPRPTGADKTSLLFQLPHRPGALADAMVVFQKHQLNLTWIESFPVHQRIQEYQFFVEFEGHHHEAKPSQAIAHLAAQSQTLTVLGSYPKAKMVDADAANLSTQPTL
ncbi:MAG: prephenate dehydratase [Pirellulaceae bacterium]